MKTYTEVQHVKQKLSWSWVFALNALLVLSVCHHVLPRSVCNHCLLFWQPRGSFLVLFLSSLGEQFPRLRDGHLKVSLDVWCPLSCFLSRTVSKSSEVRPQGGQSMLHVVLTALAGCLRSFSC